MKQTAVEWLVQRMKHICKWDEYMILENLGHIDRAKQMDKEQKIDAHIEGQRVFDKHDHTQWTIDQAEKYYNETYGE
jgi:hypothetical protein